MFSYGDAMSRAVIVESLRAHLQAKAPFIDRAPGPASGVPELDAWIQGLPEGALTRLTGPRGAGSTRLAAKILAARTRDGAAVAWIDGSETLYPPALEQAGLDLSRLLLVRRADERIVHAFEQILESGLFAATAATGLERWLTPPRLRRIQQAAEASRRITLLVTEPDSAPAFGGVALHLRVCGHRLDGSLEIEVEQDRRGWAPGRRGFVAL